MSTSIPPTSAPRDGIVDAVRSVVTIAILIGSGVALVVTQAGEAAQQLGGQLAIAGVALAVPPLAGRRTAGTAAVLALAIGAGALMSGCTPVQLLTAAHVTCGVVARANDLCQREGLSPDEECPYLAVRTEAVPSR